MNAEIEFIVKNLKRLLTSDCYQYSDAYVGTEDIWRLLLLVYWVGSMLIRSM